MNKARVAAAVLLLLLALAVVRPIPPSDPIRAERSAKLAVLLVPAATPEDVTTLGGVAAALPCRDGGAGWDILAVLASGSRSPTPGPYLADRLRDAGIGTTATGSLGRSLLRSAGAAPSGTARVTVIDEDIFLRVSADTARQKLREHVDRWRAQGARVLVLAAWPPPGRRLGALVLIDGERRGRQFVAPTAGSRPGIVPATDIAALCLALVGGEATVGVGRAPRWGRGAFDLPDAVARWEAQARRQRLLVFVPWGISGLLLIGAGRLAIAVPLALLLLGGILPPSTAPVLSYAVASLAAMALAFFLSQRRLAWLATAVILMDTALGGGLLATTPFSYGVAEAARFYGIGNEVAGYLLGSIFVAAGRDRWTVAIFGAAAALALGGPGLGANAGCFAALLIGITVSLVASLPRSQRARALAVAAVAVVMLLAAVSGLDALRGERSSHIGRAVRSIDSGGWGAIVTIATRKLTMNVHLLGSSPWALLLLVEAGVLVSRGRREGVVSEPGVLGAAAAALVLNDSGVVAAATALLWGTAMAARPSPGGIAAGEDADSA